MKVTPCEVVKCRLGTVAAGGIYEEGRDERHYFRHTPVGA